MISCIINTTIERIFVNEYGEEVNRTVEKQTKVVADDIKTREIDKSNFDYKAYLNSEEWKSKRLMVLRRDNFVCQKCFAAKNVDVHHLTYERIGNEQLSDLITLCRNCHEETHSVKEENIKKETQSNNIPRILAEELIISDILQHHNIDFYRSFFDSSDFRYWGFVFGTIAELSHEGSLLVTVDMLIKSLEKDNKLYKYPCRGKKHLRNMAEIDLTLYSMENIIIVLSGE